MRVCKNHSHITIPKERCFTMFLEELKEMEVVNAQMRVAELLRLCSYISKMDVIVSSSQNGLVRPTGQIIVVLDKPVDVERALSEARRTAPESNAHLSVTDTSFLKCHAHKHVCIDLNFQPFNCKVPPSCLIGKIKHTNGKGSGEGASTGVGHGKKRKSFDSDEEEMAEFGVSGLPKGTSSRPAPGRRPALVPAKPTVGADNSGGASYEAAMEQIHIDQQLKRANHYLFSRVTGLHQFNLDMMRVLRSIELRRTTIVRPFTSEDRFFAVLWDESCRYMSSSVIGRDQSRADDLGWVDQINDILLQTQNKIIYVESMPSQPEAAPAMSDNCSTVEQLMGMIDTVINTFKNIINIAVASSKWIQSNQAAVIEAAIAREVKNEIIFNQRMINLTVHVNPTISIPPPLKVTNSGNNLRAVHSLSSSSLTSHFSPESHADAPTRLNSEFDFSNVSRASALNVKSLLDSYQTKPLPSCSSLLPVSQSTLELLRTSSGSSDVLGSSFRGGHPSYNNLMKPTESMYNLLDYANRDRTCSGNGDYVRKIDNVNDLFFPGEIVEKQRGGSKSPASEPDPVNIDSVDIEGATSLQNLFFSS
jgi:hypothetical protein